MRLEQIHYFLVAAESHSFNIASQQLFISEQALSKSLRLLEEELHCKLFVRSNKGILITEHGKNLYHTFKEIDSLLKEVEIYAQKQAKKQSATQEQFFVSVGNGLCSLLTPTIKFFTDQYPFVQPIILEKGSLYTPQSIQSLESNLVLTQIRPGNYPDFQALEAKYNLWHLCTETLCLATGQTNPLARNKTLPFQILNDATICFYTSTLDDQPLSLKILREYPIQPKSIIPISSSQLMISYIKDNLAYALVTQTRCGVFFTPMPDLVLIPLTPKTKIDLVLFTHKTALTKSEAIFSQLLIKTFPKPMQIF